MTLPTFLGIGVPRAGTTWLHTLLSGNPEVCLPTQRKEIRFFDRYYERGLDWYESFFCSPEEAPAYGAIGEISPQYVYCEATPGRISAALPEVKLLIMLRHPVDRAYSQFGFVAQRRNYGGSFEDFLATRPNALEYGFYGHYLKRYLRFFDRSRILPLLFEEVMADKRMASERLAAFLGLSVDGFPSSVERVNPSTVPRFPALSSVAVRAGRTLRRSHLEGVVDLGARFGGRRLLTSGKRVEPLSADKRRTLTRRYASDFEDLEECLQIDVSLWRR